MLAAIGLTQVDLSRRFRERLTATPGTSNRPDTTAAAKAEKSARPESGGRRSCSTARHHQGTWLSHAETSPVSKPSAKKGPITTRPWMSW